MTERQSEFYKFIKTFIKQRGHSPTLKEIGAGMGVRSLATVHKQVHHLADQGYIALNKSAGAANISLIPEVLHGFHFCDVNHELIFYQSSACPMCRLLAAGAREVL
jgi:SOS-response transcriptional repressor LexA